MADHPFTIRYTGLDAGQHFLPAYEAGIAIAGVARTASLVAHYLIEQEIRKRAPFSKAFRVDYLSNKPGSVEELFRLVIDNPIAQGVGAALIWDGIKLVTSKVVGKSTQPQTDRLAEIDNTRSGDIDALTEAIEPSVKNIHAPIGGGANQVIMITGGTNTFVFNERTKQYVTTTEIDRQISAKQVSIGSFNVNTRYGRCFDQDEGRTIPFIVAADAEARTVPTIGRSLSRYASRGNDSWIYIKYRAQRSPEGAIKRYIVYDAWVLDQ
jgi:hypothetical protein